MGYAQQERMHRINILRATIQKARNENVVLDEQKFINEICAQFGATERKAKEYLRAAGFYENGQTN